MININEKQITELYDWYEQNKKKENITYASVLYFLGWSSMEWQEALGRYRSGLLRDKELALFEKIRNIMLKIDVKNEIAACAGKLNYNTWVRLKNIYFPNFFNKIKEKDISAAVERRQEIEEAQSISPVDLGKLNEQN